MGLARLRQRLQPLLARLPPAGRSAKIGWLLQDEAGGFLWDDPRPFPRSAPTASHAKSAAYCPAILDYEARLFEVACPCDLRLGLKLAPGEAPALVDLYGERSAVRASHLGRVVHMMACSEWRHPERPVLQIPTPYVFLADEPVWLN